MTLEINLGKRNGLTPTELIGVINRATPGPALRIGRIQIDEQISQFEVPGEAARDLAFALAQATYAGRKIKTRPAAPRARRPTASGAVLR